MSGEFTHALKNFQAAQSLYQKFGTYDTEPRTEFVLMLERVAQGKPEDVPCATANGWDLYSSMSGHIRANQALTRAAKDVVKAAKIDQQGLLFWLRDNYGIEVA